MKNFSMVSWVQYVLLAFIAVGLAGCGKNNDTNTATITIKLPAEFSKPQTGSIAPAAVTGKPENITRIIVTVSDTKNVVYGSADILATGGSLSVEVPAYVDLTVSGLAYAEQTLKFRGSTLVSALAPGSKSQAPLTLTSVDGTGGTIIIDGITGPVSGTVDLLEVNDKGDVVGSVIASAAVVEGKFTLIIPSTVTPGSNIVVRADINGQTLDARYIDAANIEVSPLTYAVSRLVNQLVPLAEGGLSDISVAEIVEMQRELTHIRDLHGPFNPNDEVENTLDLYADALIQILKGDVETSAVATSAVMILAEHQICGHVVDTSQVPLAGMRIVARDFATLLKASQTTTDAGGNYCLNVPSAAQIDPFTNYSTSGEYIIGALNFTDKSGAASQWWTVNGPTASRIDAGKIAFSPGALRETADFILPVGARVQGVVMAASTSQPLPGIQIVVRDKTTQYLVAGTTTAANGVYRLNVPAGQYIIEARNHTGQPYASGTFASAGAKNNWNDAEVITLTNNSVATANLALLGGELFSGSIAENSVATIGARVIVNKNAGGPATRFHVSSVDGHFNLWLAPDSYKVFARGQQATVDLSVGPQALPLAFSATVAKLPLMVQQAGSGVSKTNVQLYFDNNGTLQLTDADVSKSDGSLVLYSAHTGNHVVAAKVEGVALHASIVHADQTQRLLGNRIALSTGQTAATLLLSTPQAGVLTGTVSSDGVSSLSNVQVTVRQGGVTSANDFVSTGTRGDGTYTLSLPGGIAYDDVNFSAGSNSVDCSNVLVTTGTTTKLDVNFSALPPCNTSQVANSAPIANAGANRSVSAGTSTPVVLDGSASTDPDNDTLTYTWSVISIPVGSTAKLSSTKAVNPDFRADKLGDYKFQLVVNDGQINSAASMVTITAINDKPVANAGGNQIVTAPGTVILNGSTSSDINGDKLTYLWTFTTNIPVGTKATLSDPTAENPTFNADVLGTYELQLIVNDGLLDSDPVKVIITAAAAAVKLQLIGTGLIGVGRVAQVQVNLTSPAPAGGTTVTVTSDNTGIATLAQPNTVVIAQGASSGQIAVNGVAAGPTKLHGVASGYTEGVLDVSVTLNLIGVPTTLNVPLGQTANMPITIAPDAAPVGGVVVNIVSGDPTIGEVVTSSVTIAEGLRSANAVIKGISLGDVSVTVGNANYASATAKVSVTAALNISGANVTNNSLLTMTSGFPQQIAVLLQSAGASTPATQPVVITLAAVDPSCVTVTSPVTISTGSASANATVSYGGSATLPCSTKLTASSPNFTSKTIDAIINSSTFQFPYEPINVGAGLQTNYDPTFGQAAAIKLSEVHHGGVTVRIKSSDPTKALVSPDEATPGTEFIDVPVADGITLIRYYMQGVEGATGAVNFTASAPGFIDASGVVNVVQPELQVYWVSTPMTTLSPDREFWIQLNVPYAGPGSYGTNQPIRPGGKALPITITNSNSAVAQFITTATPSGSQTVTATIDVGKASTPYTVVTGGVAFHPVGSGATTISASNPNLASSNYSSYTVNVAAPVMQFLGANVTVGSGLQTQYYNNTQQYNYSPQGISVGSPSAKSVTVHLVSDTPSVVLLSPDGIAAGSSAIDVVIPAGQYVVNYFTQGVEGLTSGAATITASATGYTEVSSTVTVVQPTINLYTPYPTTNTFAANIDLQVAIGILGKTNSGLDTISEYQAVRAGRAPITATVTSSNPAVGLLINALNPLGNGSVDVVLKPGQYATPSAIVDGGLQFDPIGVDSAGANTTTISATIPGFASSTFASKDITVTAPTMTFATPTTVLGSGLQIDDLYYLTYVTLGEANHGGVTVTISSDNPNVLLAPDRFTAGKPSIDVFVANGKTQAFYIPQALEGFTGSNIKLTAKATGFSDAPPATVNVVQPAIGIGGVPATTTTLSPSSSVAMYFGPPDATNSWILGSRPQALRFGGPGLGVTFTSSDSNVGQMILQGAVSGASVSVTVLPGQSHSPYTYATGGAAFQPLTSGTTVVSGSAPGFINTTGASVSVNVAPPSLVFRYLDYSVGAGLQTSGSAYLMYVTLGAVSDGNVIVHIKSSNPNLVQLSVDEKTLGSGSVDIAVPNGTDKAYYIVQGVEGASGSVTLTATAPGYSDGSTTANVMLPAIDIYSITSSLSASAADYPFQVRIGPAYPGNPYITEAQTVRTNGAPVTVTINSSDASVGTLSTSSTVAGTVTMDIGPGQAMTPASVAAGGVAFHPLKSGVTTVTATGKVNNTDLILTDRATATVTVTP